MNPQELVRKTLGVVEEQEKWRGTETINLIASENVMSPVARSVFASDFMHRYAEGTIGNRMYEGTRLVDTVEQFCVDLLKSLYKVEYADVRPISGALANLAVFYAFAKPGDSAMSLNVSSGAHISYREFGSAGCRGLKVVDIPFDNGEMNIDLERFSDLARKVKPKIITLGGSLFLFPSPVKEIREVADEVGAIVHYDGAHVMGLILGGKFQDPLAEGAQILTGSTHKTLPGPQGGVLLTPDENMFKSLKKAIYPGLVSNHHLHRLPSLAITLAEMVTFGKEYAEQIVKNAKALGEALRRFGFNVLCSHKGFTESHQVALDVSKMGGGDRVAKTLAMANIIANKNLLPWDAVKNVDNPSGVRLGTQEVTRRGLKEADMRTIAEFIKRLVIDGEKPSMVKDEVIQVRRQFPTITYCF
jgi:glycine hydroxymethyltransferase